MMKLYFLYPDNQPLIAEFTNESDAPAHSHVFDLAEGASLFEPRYALDKDKLVDKFPGLTDEEVAAAILAEDQAKAEALAAQNTQTV